ncbi:MAG: hypothetical protein GX155_09515 [Smithella sp.]|nr:hypothetical protein [Smithella sp.]
MNSIVINLYFKAGATFISPLSTRGYIIPAGHNPPAGTHARRPNTRTCCWQPRRVLFTAGAGKFPPCRGRPHRRPSVMRRFVDE